MAKANFKLPDEFLTKLSRLGKDTDAVAEKVLEAGGSNAKIANILEYGKSGQPPKPFLKPAKSAARAECIRVMEQTLKEEVEKL